LKIIVSIDDGCKLDVRVAELLDKYNLPAIFYIPVMWESYNRSKGWEGLSYDDVISIGNRFDIGSHSITHALLTKVPSAVADFEIIESKTMLQQAIGKEVTSFCYPRGYANEHHKAIVRRVYNTGRSVIVGAVEEGDDPAFQPVSVHACCERKEYFGEHWLDYGRKKIHEAQRKPVTGYFHLMCHSWEIEKNDGWKHFELFLAELASEDTSR